MKYQSRVDVLWQCINDERQQTIDANLLIREQCEANSVLFHSRINLCKSSNLHSGVVYLSPIHRIPLEQLTSTF